MKFYTAQYRYPGPYRLDITVKGNDLLGTAFAPTWGILNQYKKQIGTVSAEYAEQNYIRQYHQLMLESYNVNRRSWEEILSREYVVLVCFCAAGNFCHRHLLTHYLQQLGAQYCGEITDFSKWQNKKTYYYGHHESECVWISDDPNEEDKGDGMVVRLTKDEFDNLDAMGYRNAGYTGS